MGHTKGSLEVRTYIERNKIVTEANASIEDSDNDRELLNYAAKINSEFSRILTDYNTRTLRGDNVVSPQRFIERYLESERR